MYNEFGVTFEYYLCIIYNIFLLYCMFCIFITCSVSYCHIDQLTDLQNCMYAHLYTCV